MMRPLTEGDITYICHSMMGVDWTPSFLRDGNVQQILKILSKCQSKLEVIYFLGMLYYLRSNSYKNGKGQVSKDYPLCWSDIYDQQEGLWISDPSCGGHLGNGFSSLFVVPQYSSPHNENIHHDFGFFASDSIDSSDFSFYAAIEIEGYAIHRQQRKADEERYRNLPYRVIQVFEEVSEPLYWYSIFDPDVVTDILGEFISDDFDYYPHGYDPFLHDNDAFSEISVKEFKSFSGPYTSGDRIYHHTFGEGIVLTSKREGQTELIDVHFQDQYGNINKKRLNVGLANLVRLHRISLTLDYIQKYL